MLFASRIKINLIHYITANHSLQIVKQVLKSMNTVSYVFRMKRLYMYQGEYFFLVTYETVMQKWLGLKRENHCLSEMNT